MIVGEADLGLPKRKRFSGRRIGRNVIGDHTSRATGVHHCKAASRAGGALHFFCRGETRRKEKRHSNECLFGFRQLPIFPGRLQPSIVGVCALNFCVRDGNRWDRTA